MSKYQNPKLVLSTLILISLLAGGALLYSFDQNTRYQLRLLVSKDSDILSYVPADTSFFSGGTQAKPFRHVLDLYAPEFRWLKHINWRQMKQSYTPGESPAANIIYGLITEYLLMLSGADFSPRDLGLADPFHSALYTIDLLPVYRLQLSHAEQFMKYVDRAQITAQLTPRLSRLGEFQLRHYPLESPLSKPDDEGHARIGSPTNIKATFIHTTELQQEQAPQIPIDSRGFELIIASNGHYGLITLAPRGQQTLLKRLLGMDKPEQSLKDSGFARQLQQQQGFWPAMFGFINTKSIVRHTLNPDNPVAAKLDQFFKLMVQLSEDLDKYRKSGFAPGRQNRLLPAGNELNDDMHKDKESQEPLPENNADILFEQDFLGNEQIKQFIAGIRHPACQDYIKEAAQNWPTVAFGYTRFDLNHIPNHQHKVVYRNTDREFLQAAINTRGYFPDFMSLLNQQPLLSLSMGANMNQLAPYYTTIMKKEAKHSHCVLSYVQQGAWGVGANVMVANVMTQMLRGLQGISFNLLDAQWQQKELKNLELIISISADDPQSLLMMFSPLSRWVPLMDIPQDGTPLEIAADLDLPLAQQIFATVKGQHIVFYTGEKAALTVNKLQPEHQKTGMMELHMDLTRLTISALDAAFKNSKAEKKQLFYNQQVQDAIKSDSVRSSYTIDADLQAYVYSSRSSP